ncbi:MAG: pyridoxamine 5'-phosphate oxidase family protein [Burkholderiales bacterium]
MSHAFANIAFTPAVKAAQILDGSRANYARNFEAGNAMRNDRMGDTEVEFIKSQRSFYIATVSETGWPYIQHRGGPRGFLKVIDEKTLAFADFAGNRQMISVGNAANNDRVALILVDYSRRVRLKVLGRLAIEALTPAHPHAEMLIAPEYRAKPQRVFMITVEGFDWNCPQHIPLRFDAEDVERSLAERDARIAELEAKLTAVSSRTPA